MPYQCRRVFLCLGKRKTSIGNLRLFLGKNISPFETQADTTRLFDKSKKVQSSDGVKKIFSVKALAGSMLSVAGVAAVTVVAVLTSVILNVALFAATAFSLTFKLDINYQDDDPLVAVLSRDGFSDEIPLNGDEYVTFDGLTPDTEYLFSIVRANGEVLYSASYKTEKEGVGYDYSVWVSGAQGNDLVLGVLFESEKLPDFYTITVTTKSGRKDFSADREPQRSIGSDWEEEWSDQIYEENTYVFIPDYPFDETCIVTVTAGNKGVATLTVLSPGDYHFTEKDVFAESDVIKVTFDTAKPDEYFYAIVGEEYVSGETIDGLVTFVAQDLTPSTSYEFVIYNGIANLPVFRKTYSTVAGPNTLLQLDEEFFEEYDDGFYASFILSDPNEEGFYATLNGESIEYDTYDNNVYYTQFGLTPFVDYTFIVYNQLSDEVVYTHSFSTRGPLIEEVMFSYNENNISAEFTVTNPYDIQVYATLNDMTVEYDGGEAFMYDALTPATEYEFRICNATTSSVLYSKVFTTPGVLVEETYFDVTETELTAKYLIADPYEVGVKVTLNDSPVMLNEDVLELNGLTPGTDYSLCFYRNDTNEIVYSTMFTTNGASATETDIEYGFDHLTVTLAIHNPTEEELTFAFEGETRSVSVDENGVVVWSETNLLAGTTYTFTVSTGSYTVFEQTYLTDHTVSIVYNSDTSAYVVKPYDSFLAYMTDNSYSYYYTVADEMGNEMMGEGSDGEFYDLVPYSDPFLRYDGTYTITVYGDHFEAETYQQVMETGLTRPTLTLSFDPSTDEMTITIVDGDKPQGTTVLVISEHDEVSSYAVPFDLTSTDESSVTVLVGGDFSKAPGQYTVRITEDSDYYTLTTATFTIDE